MTMRILQCARCDGGFTHHDDVQVFARAEDADGFRVHVNAQNAVILDTDLRGNPSSRRHGLTISFWCESCGGRSLLDIAQHKGITYLEVKKDDLTPAMPFAEGSLDADDQPAGAPGAQEAQE